MCGRRMLVLLAAAAATACGDSPTSVRTTSYQLKFEAIDDNPVAGYRYTCSASARFSAPRAFPVSWSGELDFQVMRIAMNGGLTARADTVVRGATVTIVVAEDGNATLDSDGPFGGRTTGSLQDPQWDGAVAVGPWWCGPEFPLAARPDLVEVGQSPLAWIMGQWYLTYAR